MHEKRKRTTRITRINRIHRMTRAIGAPSAENIATQIKRWRFDLAGKR
jgi:hypothetical protein